MILGILYFVWVRCIYVAKRTPVEIAPQTRCIREKPRFQVPLSKGKMNKFSHSRIKSTRKIVLKRRQDLFGYFAINVY